ncbi:MAG: ABC transporter permease [Chloroflexota bacterium]
MNVLQSFLEAMRSLTANKLRSALTVLGIVIGVAAVIAMLAIGRGAEKSITRAVEGIGTNVLYVFSGGKEGLRNPRPLTLLDVAALEEASSVSYVAPSLQGNAQVSYGGDTTNTSIVGVTPDYAAVSNLAVAEGEMLSDANLVERAAVVVIGADVAESLFGRTEDIVGEKVRIMGQPFSVIGVLERKGGSGFGSQDDQVLVPLTTAQTRLIRRPSRQQVDMILVQAASAALVDRAVEDVTAILAERHHTTIDEPDFQILNQQAILSSLQSVIGVLTIFLGGIASISLLVGGIGIMNIMLVSVTERTREIGLRKAVGARKRDILAQFLVESSVLSLLGGIVGILLAWGIAAIVAQVAAANEVEIAPAIELDAVLLATLFSAAVGLFFGFYPARRAANLEPVEALRSE